VNKKNRIVQAKWQRSAKGAEKKTNPIVFYKRKFFGKFRNLDLL